MESLRPRDPKAIGPYKLVGRLGAGGMGVVYIASKGSETVALKIIRDSIIDDPSQATRFIREIETLKSIDSPHVAKVLDTGTHHERPWFTTEFVNGPDLKSHVTDKGPMPEASWDALAKGLLDGIAAIHAAGVIHRDIKPANIILSESGPKIIDFGIAQVADATSVTSTGAIAGTPAWFSPEQIEGSEISTATDLFSAGSTLVYAATGKSPWGDVEATTKASVYKILLDEPDLSGLSEKQSRLVRPLLNKDPNERSRDGSPPIESRSKVSSSSGESSFKQLGKLSRSRMLLGSLAVILFASIGGIALTTFAAPSPDEALDDGLVPFSAREVSVEPEPVSPLGPEFFEDIALGMELKSAQFEERITFAVSGPGATYVRSADMTMRGMPAEWFEACQSPLALARAPVAEPLWTGGCELSLPQSGETVPVAGEANFTFIDNDGTQYSLAKEMTFELETLETPPPRGLRITGVDQSDNWALTPREEVFTVGETLIFCQRGNSAPYAQAALDEGYGGPTWAVMTAGGYNIISRGVLVVGSVDPPVDADLGCREFNYFPNDNSYNASQRVDVTWNALAPFARSDGSVLIKVSFEYSYYEFIVERR